MKKPNGGATPRRKKIVVKYDDKQLELFAIGEVSGIMDEEWTEAEQTYLCEDRTRERLFFVNVKQRLFTTLPLRIRTSRVPKKYAASYREKKTPLAPKRRWEGVSL